MAQESVVYSIEAPNGQTYKIPGPPGASQEDVQAEVLRQHPEAVKPVSQAAVQQRTNGTNISSDVPNVITAQNRGSVAPVEPTRTMADKLRALYEVPAAVGSNMLAQPIGAAYGIYKGVTSPNYGTQQGVQEAQQAGGEVANKLQFTPSSPVTQDVLESVGKAMESARLPVTPGGIGQLPSFTQQVKNVAQYSKPFVSEAVQTAKPAINTMAQALRREPSVLKTAPTSETLAQQSSNLFKSAKESGVELNAKDFSTNMAQIGKDLRSEGYDPRLYPKLSVALDEMTKAGIPKDFNELSTLRKFIQAAQKSADPDERRLATMLKDDFDNYVATIPESSVVGGNKQGLADWKKARDTYSKLSKSEVFTDMLENAQLDTSKFSMSGTENSLAQQLRQLAKNDKKMRLFTAEEQEAIKAAAKGGTTQNLLRFFGKFAPTSSVGSIAPILATAANAPLGLALTAGGIGARYGATQIRKNDVNKLAAMMRAGIRKGNENE